MTIAVNVFRNVADKQWIHSNEARKLQTLLQTHATKNNTSSAVDGAS